MVRSRGLSRSPLPYLALLLSALPWALPWIGTQSQPTIVVLLAIAAAVAITALATARGAAELAISGTALLALGLFVADVLFAETGALRTSAPSRPPERPVERLRIVDFNVLHGYPDFSEQSPRMLRTITSLVALEPDIVVLQEAWRTPRGDFTEELGAALGMNWAYARANGRVGRIGFEEGEAILSRFPIVSAERIALAPRRPFYERRVALLCELDLGGESLTVVGVHLGHRSDATALAQSAFLAERLAPVAPSVVAGDLNQPSGGAAVRAWTEAGYVDVLPGGIDHVLIREGVPWKAIRARWELEPPSGGSPIVFSDHPAIVVDLGRPAS